MNTTHSTFSSAKHTQARRRRSKQRRPGRAPPREYPALGGNSESHRRSCDNAVTALVWCGVDRRLAVRVSGVETRASSLVLARAVSPHIGHTRARGHPAAVHANAACSETLVRSAPPPSMAPPQTTSAATTPVAVDSEVDLDSTRGSRQTRRGSTSLVSLMPRPIRFTSCVILQSNTQTHTHVRTHTHSVQHATPLTYRAVVEAAHAHERPARYRTAQDLHTTASPWRASSNTRTRQHGRVLPDPFRPKSAARPASLSVPTHAAAFFFLFFVCSAPAGACLVRATQLLRTHQHTSARVCASSAHPHPRRCLTSPTPHTLACFASFLTWLSALAHIEVADTARERRSAHRWLLQHR